MINFSLAREIYGLNPWFVDAKSLPGLLGSLNILESLEIPDIKYNTPVLYDPSNSTFLPPPPKNEDKDARVVDDPYGYGWYQGQLDTMEQFTAIAVIKIDGPITLSGGMSSVGMEQLSELMMKLNNDMRVKAFIILADSGGGSSSAVEVMVDTINEIKVEKPVYGLIKKGGMAASACFGILSACDKIYSASEMNIVGSSGTMVQFSGRPANTKDDKGVKHIRLYATKSTRKNEDFEQALNNDNYEIIVNDLLDPVNEKFLQLIETNRPILKGTDFDDGHIKFSKDAVGTFIDGLKSFSETVDEVLENLKIESSNNNNKLNNNSMTQSEFQAAHPEAYKAIYNAGVAAEQDRTGAWLAHLSTDSAAVLKGIASGEAISQTQTQQFIVKQASNQQLKDLKQDSPKDAPTQEAGADKPKEGEDTDEPTEVDNFYAGIDKKLKAKYNKED